MLGMPTDGSSKASEQLFLTCLVELVSDVTWASRRLYCYQGETPTAGWTSQRPTVCFQDCFTPKMPPHTELTAIPHLPVSWEPLVSLF